MEQSMSPRLRPYQTQAVQATLSEPDPCIVAIPTGGGKTVVGAATEWLHRRETGLPTLWIAHREELIKQAASTFQYIDGKTRLSYWTADRKDSSGDVVLAMIGSTRTLDDKKFGLVVVDEAHHFAKEDEDYTNMYNKLLKRLRYDKLVGLTATPGRLDDRGLAFKKVAYSISFYDLVRKHRLARPVYREMVTNQGFELQMRGGEFTSKSLAKLDDKERNEKIVEELVKNKEAYGKTLLFCVNVQHCNDLQEILRQKDSRLETAIITGDTLDSQRANILKWYKEGVPKEPKVLLNCQVFTEGLDEPSIKTVFLARPTLSKTLWMQMVGRGSRIFTLDWYNDKNVPIGVEPAGDDGVQKLSFTNGSWGYGEEVGHNAWRLHVDEEFNLVNVMDDITRYNTLVEDWKLDIQEATPKQLEEATIRVEMDEMEKEIKKVKKEEELSSLDKSTLGNAQIRDVLAILVFSTRYTKNAGILLDVDRYNCLHRLHDYAETCKVVRMGIEQFDIDAYQEAYSFCVLKGEFSYRLFENIRLAHYYRFIQNREKVEYNRDGKMYGTWKVVPLKDVSPESRAGYIERARIDAEEARKANEAFNKQYGENGQPLLERIAKRASYDVDDDKDLRAVAVASKGLKVISASNRRIRAAYVKPVKTWPMRGMLVRAAGVLTKYLQEYLDDPTALITIVPTNLLIKQDMEYRRY